MKGDYTHKSIIAETVECAVVSVRVPWVLLFVAVSFAFGFILGIIAGGR